MTNLSTMLERQDHLEHAKTMTLSRARIHWREFREENGLCGAPKLLTYPEGQHKLGKSKAYTVGLTLQSADGAGVETCPWRGQCAAVCVLKNGNGAYPHVQLVRDVRTRFLQHYPVSFMRLLVHELDRLTSGVAFSAPPFRCRLNMNSDLRWHRIAPWLFERYEGTILFYDYTKNPAVLSTEKGLVAPNYLQVYSLNERSDDAKVLDFLASGGKVAAVTNRKKGQPVKQWPIHAHTWSVSVVDGDVTDDLWSHPEGSIIDLTAKGKARTQGPGFVRYVY